MISKLLLIRKKNMRSDLVDKLGISKFVVGEPLNVIPQVWNDEAGISHYGFVLEGMKVKDMAILKEAVEANDEYTLLDYSGDSIAALASVGLRINESI